jgi:hypothetical protein
MSEPGSTRPSGWLDHWAPPPAGASPAQVYEWRLRNEATDAINQQTTAMRELLVEQKKLVDIQAGIRDELAAQPPQPSVSTQERLIFKTLEAARGFVKAG